MKLVKEGNKIALGEIKVEDKQLIGRISHPLVNGSYTIQWKIVGEDGHPINGQINFSVQTSQNQPETNTVSPEKNQGTPEEHNQANQTEQNTASDTVEQTEDNSSSNMLVIIAIILVVIFGIVLLLFTGKKKR
jgi:hypothetical protein